MSKKDMKEPVTEIPEELMNEIEDGGYGEEKADEPEKKEEEKKDEAHERYIRLAADFDNFRKRVAKEKAEYVRYAAENLVRDLLPIIDNLERALEHSKTEEKTPLAEGVGLTVNQLHSTLQKFGIRGESSVGKPFDPMVHDAVSHSFSNDVPANSVMQEHHKAYFLHDRLLRPAMVTVSKGPETANPEDNSGLQAE
jgi:molecular chaperone GrpE